jgi:hypothetical protein
MFFFKALKGCTYKFADRMLEPGMRDEEGREEKIKGKWWEKEI